MTVISNWSADEVIFSEIFDFELDLQVCISAGLQSSDFPSIYLSSVYFSRFLELDFLSINITTIF